MIYDKYAPPVYVEIEQPEEIVVQPLQSKVTFVASENQTESEKFLASLRSLGKTLGKPKKKKKKPQCKQNN
jgi:ABC-type hemin transport system substrate-binding protein